MQGVQAVSPQRAVVVQPGVHLGEWLRRQAVDPPLRLLANRNQAGFADHPQVTRNARASNRKRVGEFPAVAGWSRKISSSLRLLQHQAPRPALLDFTVVDRPLRRIAVFCGSAAGTDPKLSPHSYEVGRGLADRGIGLVYGAGGSGLMRAVSQGALDAGGEVVGVIPRSMVEREWGRSDLPEMRVVETMHERKALMAAYADAFLCLPGGLGTLEEIIEVWSWRQIGFNDDPVGFLNVDGFWTPLLAALDGLVDAGFVRREVMDDLVVADNLDEALDGLADRVAATSGDKLRTNSS